MAEIVANLVFFAALVGMTVYCVVHGDARGAGWAGLFVGISIFTAMQFVGQWWPRVKGIASEPITGGVLGLLSALTLAVSVLAGEAWAIAIAAVVLGWSALVFAYGVGQITIARRRAKQMREIEKAYGGTYHGGKWENGDNATER